MMADEVFKAASERAFRCIYIPPELRQKRSEISILKLVGRVDELEPTKKRVSRRFKPVRELK